MPYIDITSMGGEMPRIIPTMLPEKSATLTENCHFRFGVVSPCTQESDVGEAFSINPRSIFHYRDNFWFAWPGITDAIRSPVAQDPYGRVYYTDGKFPKVTSAAVATKGSGNYPAAFFRLGIPAPTTAIMCVVNLPQNPGNDDPTDDETRYYAETYVTAYGEEGPPGPASGKVIVTYPGSSVDLSLQAPAIQNSNITRRRIYRSVSGDGKADFLLVTELDVGVLSYRDELSSDELGPAMQTWHYLPPPENMQGLCLMANGIAAGFAGNEVMFSESFLPYAWPDSYRQTTEDDIVAIAPVGTALVVATKGEPYLFSGVSPSNISGMKLPQTQACVSRESMVAMDGFVLYAGTNGLASVDGNGNAVNATEKIISAEQWNSMFNPSSIRACLCRGEYVASYTRPDGSAGIFIFNPQDMDIRHMTASFDAAYHQLESDTLYLVKNKKLHIFQGGTKPVPMRWRSKIFMATEGTSFSCLRIHSDNPQLVGVTLYVDGRQAVQLPPGTLSRGILKLPPVAGTEWQIEVSGFTRVERITLSTSMTEMPA
ncbi:hypothetical protein MSU25_000125 [Salmonella enterica]|uniref:Uncharacterized protein n=2 Tax=Salmonella enterica TaxID=28901 RepID=A0A633DL72_SALER|nr:hypothetical protein [Salmonella enterica]EAS0615877.1 hypothetical protein [Salmonella enterica subsp. enterica serovar Dahomey]EBQ9004710.1 hypothetical protein [Salmonella enterica subsp. enterica serovar Blockley]EBQ9480307.1 hypothetical protein [Salmonella enterica subsp. enterica serovar Kokomlemle]EBV8414132.1 hypothetical protein [Salmonella enterica subsp. enterica serovar Oranienburg]EBW2603582.1 hypothetical protein [Salmonella enterica subsp. enterica serovar Poano]EBZ5140034.